MPCEDCEEYGTIFRTKGSWVIESHDIWTLTVTCDYDRTHDLLLKSREEAIYWYERALSKKSDFVIRWYFRPKEVHGVFRTRTLREKLHMVCPGAPSFEEQRPQ